MNASASDRPQIVIRGGDYEHVLDIAEGHCGRTRLGYEVMRIQDTFRGMVESGRFEVCEFSLANYMTLRGTGQNWLIALPVFPYRAFRHSLAVVRRDSTLAGLGQLLGKRIGVDDYSMTAAVWFRGLLQDEYGVDHRSITWVTGSRQRFPVPPQARVETTDANLEELLCAGSIDALLGIALKDARLPLPRRQLRTLLSEPQADEKAYYERTGIYPIHHCVVIRNSALEGNPDLADTVYEAYAAAKEHAYQRQLGATLMPWGHAYWNRTFALFDDDPLPYGLTPHNRRVIGQLGRYLQEQGFIADTPDIDGLFRLPSTGP